MNKPKIIGTAWETAVVRYLREHGFRKAERRALNGGKDLGDIVNVPSTVLECKNEKSISLAQYMRELDDEMDNAKATFGAAVVKRRGQNVSNAYAVMPLWLYVRMLGSALGLEDAA